MRKSLSFLFFLCCCLSVCSQEKDSTLKRRYLVNDKTDFSLLAGINQGRYSFAELGLAVVKYSYRSAIACFIASEVKLSQNVLVGPKVGISIVGNGLGLGFNFLYYTNFHKSTFVFRPEFGMGIEKMKLTYGYNWNWSAGIPGINRNQVGLTYLFKLKRLKESSSFFYR
jgi:hypothetical protein